MPDYSKMTDAELISLAKAQGIEVKPKAIAQTETISPIESGITGASVGGSLGLTRPVLTAAGKAAGLPWGESWKASGEFIKEAKEQNPKAYGAGMLGSIFIPGGGFATATKGAKAAFAGTNAVRPALAGLAATTAASGLQAGTQAMAEDRESKAAEEILQAMALNVGAFGLGEVVKKGATVAKKGGQKILGSLQNISKDAIETYEKNPKAVKALIADKLGTFAPQLADHTAERIKEVGTALESQLDEVVSKFKGTVDVKPVISEIESQISNLGRVTVTPDVRSALFTLKKSLSALYTKGKSTLVDPYLGTVSKTTAEPVKYTAKDLLTLKRDLQRAATAVYEGRDTGPINEAFAAIAEKATRSLKDQVKGTAELLSQEQAAIKAKQALGLSGQVDAARVKNLIGTMLNPDKVQKGVPKAVDDFDRIFGTDLKGASALFRSAVQLGKDDVIAGYGTGRALLGPVLGAMSGGRFGGLAGLLIQSPGLARAGVTGTKVMEKSLQGLAGQLPKATRAYEAAKEKR